MKNLKDMLNESLVNEGADYVIYMPCSDPSEMEDIYWAIVDEFGDSADMRRDLWGYGDETIKCFVYAKSQSQVKKFAKEHDAEFKKR